MARVKPRFWLLLTAVMLCVFFAVYSSQKDVIVQQASALEELMQIKADLEVEIDSAERRFEFAMSDEYIERMARRECGLVMPDEILYQSAANH